MIAPIQVAKLSVFCPNSSDIGITVNTGLQPGQLRIWQLFQIDFFIDPGEVFAMDHTVDWWLGLQIAGSTESGYLGWRSMDDDTLIAQAGLHFHAEVPIGGSVAQDPFAWQWRVPVSMYFQKPFLELALNNQQTNTGFTGRANVYYKSREITALQQALLLQ